MKGKKPIKQSSIRALSKAYKNNWSQAALVDRLSTQYYKAYDLYESMRKQGFQFSKQFEKAMSYENFVKKSMHVTKKDIDYYKGFTKKSALYNKAKGYYDIDKNQLFTVAQGRLAERRKTIRRKQEEKNKENTYVELYQILDNMTTEKVTGGRVWGIAEEKRDVMNAYDKFVERGGQVTDSLKNKLTSLVDKVNYDSSAERVYGYIDSILALLNGGSSVGDGGAMELIGTPYES